MIKKHLLSLLFFAFFFSTSTLGERAWAASPHADWQKIETAHFTVIFDSKHYELAALYARFAEQAFHVTSPLFGVWPEKTVLVVDDSTDLANGLATGVPYPMIITYPVLPSSLDSISDYGNWGLELLTHEFVHILNFEPATGIMRPARWIFGSIVRPNILLPRWYSEGLATELETRLSSFGRLRSANYLSIVRSMAEENTLRVEDISRIGETGIPDWPGGARPYLMGALLWNEIIRQGGDKAVQQLNFAYSRRVPFFLNGPAQSILGMDYASLLDLAYTRAETSARKQISLIESAGPNRSDRDGVRLKQEGFFNHSPEISPDQSKLVYVSRNHNDDGSVYLLERPANGASFSTAQAKPLFKASSVSRVSWTPDSKSLIFELVDTYQRHFTLSDLYRYDFDTKKRNRLTRGLRAREATVSPDGRAIALVRNVAGSTELGSIRIDGQGYQRLITLPLQSRVAHPEFLSDTELMFTEKRDDGSESLKLVTLTRAGDGSITAANQIREVLSDFKPLHFPRLTKEGIVFVSDRSGVANIYLASRDFKTARAMTNTTTRAMTGEIDPVTSDLIYSRLTSRGPQLHLLTKNQWAQTPERVPQVAPLVETEWPRTQVPQVTIDAKAEPYSPWSYLVPRYWMPFFYSIPEGSVFSATTSASDPVGRHAYLLRADYDTLTQRPSFIGQYVNNTTPIQITFAGEDVWEYVYSGAFNRHTTAAAVNGLSYIPGFNNKWRAGFGWQYLQTDIYGDLLRRQGPQALLSYTNIEKKGLEISPEKGGAFSLVHTRYLPNLGSLEYDQTDFRSSVFFSRWLPERHAIALSANGTVAAGLNEPLLGRSTIEGTYATTPTSSLVMRGYSTGTFLGRNIVQGTAEYRFPLHYSYTGWGTTPFFAQKWHAAIFADTISLDGLAYQFDRKRYRRETLGTFYFGTGAELRLDTTIFYHIPVQMTFGAYYGSDSRLNPYGVRPFISFGI